MLRIFMNTFASANPSDAHEVHDGVGRSNHVF
jgi:hypothetical protein